MYLKLFTILCFVFLSLAAEFTEWPYEEREPATTKAIEDGRRRYEQMQTSIQDGNPDRAPAVPWCDVNRDFNVHRSEAARASGISSRLEGFINAAGLPVSTSEARFIEIGESWRADEDAANYENAYNTQDNTIAVVDIRRSSSTATDVATITWATWVKVCEDNGGNAGSLSSLIHYTCRNVKAETVALDIFGESDNIFYTFTPGEGEVHEPFYAILGLDNGTGAKNILINYQRTLGYKQLTSIVAWKDSGDSNIMGVSYQFS